jgi:hypothetical protein
MDTRLTSNVPLAPNLLSPPNPLSVSILPSALNELPAQNPLPTVNLQINANHQATSHLHSSIVGEHHIAEAISSVNPGTVNVVGQDQFNVTANFHMNPNPSVGETEEILSVCRVFNVQLRFNDLSSESSIQQIISCTESVL